MKSCDFRWFLAYSMCSHLFKASELFSFKLNNERPTRFVCRPRPGKKKGTKTFHENFEHFTEPEKANSQLAEIQNEQVSEAESEIVHEHVQVRVTRKRSARSPRVEEDQVE